MLTPSNIARDRAILAYCILEGEPIDVGRIIFHAFKQELWYAIFYVDHKVMCWNRYSMGYHEELEQLKTKVNSKTTNMFMWCPRQVGKDNNEEDKEEHEELTTPPPTQTEVG